MPHMVSWSGWFQNFASHTNEGSRRRLLFQYKRMKCRRVYKIVDEYVDIRDNDKHTPFLLAIIKGRLFLRILYDIY